MGLPASGKSFFSQRIAKELAIFYLNTDSLRMAIIPTPTFTAAEHQQVYRTADFLAEQHLQQGQSILYNANFHVRKNRQKAQKIAERHGATLCILWTQVTYEVAKQRILKRDHEIPADKMRDHPYDVLQRMHHDFQPPSPDEPVIVIDGTAPFQEQQKAFFAQLRG